MTLTATSALPVNLGDGPFAVTTSGLVKRCMGTRSVTWACPGWRSGHDEPQPVGLTASAQRPADATPYWCAVVC